MASLERTLSGKLQGVSVGPDGAEYGVLVLAGSSGRVDIQRARLLASQGALALALRWFGGSGQAPGICEIPLETFTAAIDWLVTYGAQRVGVLGLSKGAEAALLVACYDTRVRAVVAISPSSVAWANVGPGVDGQTYPYRSSWTWRGQPLPFTPYDETWTPAETSAKVAYRSLYEQSLRTFPEAAQAAAIKIEQAQAEALLIVGGADTVWPSDAFAAALAERRRNAGREIEIISHPGAGHSPLFPGEQPQKDASDVPEADFALGSAAWPRVLAYLT